jgi:midasin
MQQPPSRKRSLTDTQEAAADAGVALGKRHKGAGTAGDAGSTTTAEQFCWYQPLECLVASSQTAHALLSGVTASLGVAGGGRPEPLEVPPPSLMTALHSLLLAPGPLEETVLPLLRAYRPVMVPIMASCLQEQLVPSAATIAFDLGQHERLGYVYTLLARVLPRPDHVMLLLGTYYRQAPSPFERIMRSNAASGAEIAQEEEEAYLHIVRTAHRLLEAGGCHGHDISWAPLFSLLQCNRPVIRWYALRCVATLLSVPTSAQGPLVAAFNVCTTPPPCYLDDVEIVATENAVALSCKNAFASPIQAQSLEKWVKGLTVIGNIVLPKHESASSPEAAIAASTDPEAADSFVPTSACQRSLRAVAMAMATGKPVILEGPSGVGKTALVDELARRCGQFETMIRIHLDEQLDSKVLLGSYICTEEPGQFKWQPGALAQAVRGGRWIVFEDIHCAPFELLAAIKPLLEDKVLFVAGRGERIPASSGFQLFATQTVSDTPSSTSKSSGGGIFSDLFTHVQVDALPAADVQKVLLQKFAPTIGCCLPTMLDTFEQLNASRVGTALGRSELTLRDLIKWCKRVELTSRGQLQRPEEPQSIDQLPHALRKLCFREAVDCFCAGWAKPSAVDRAIELIRKVWGIDTRYVNMTGCWSTDKPHFQKTISVFEIGRYRLNVRESKQKTKHKISALSRQSEHSSGQYTETKHSLLVLERVAACAKLGEPCLLVGETGTGKTSSVQHIAQAVGQRLTVINLNQQTDASDLLGGFKPVDVCSLARPVLKLFEKAFCRTYSPKQNAKFLHQLRTSFRSAKWAKLVDQMRKGIAQVDTSEEQARQGRRKVIKPETRSLWRSVRQHVSSLALHTGSNKSFAFSFIEGALVSAIRNGHWVLLDEMNLAPVDTLERLSGLLDGNSGSVCLTEKGDTEAVPRHRNFRLFACMNPPTDAGKKDLPAGLRSRFTEISVPEMTGQEDLKHVVHERMQSIPSIKGPGGNKTVENIVHFYLALRKAAVNGDLLDGTDSRPVYTLRTLMRGLQYTTEMTATYGLPRALYDGMSMCFLTQLQSQYWPAFDKLVTTLLLPGRKLEDVRSSKHDKQVTETSDAQQSQTLFLSFVSKVPQPRGKLSKQEESKRTKIATRESKEGFCIPKGPLAVQTPAWYVIVPSVRMNLLNLTRAVLSQHPILLQGTTSTGKTSMIEYLALRTGHRFMRINNHDHTEIAEYIGGYSSDHDGTMKWQEGVLVSALRNGWWLVLDELNLAPSEVLEALNRLLDHNRELFIPETQEIVKPHPNFRLFATQNPPGMYGGRKILSRAFRNRFLELQVDEVSQEELGLILQLRSKIASSFAEKMILVMKDLQQARQGSRIFRGKGGFITPRDLFRWAERKPQTWLDLARHGYMLLAERTRKPEEKEFVKSTLKKHMKDASLDDDDIYCCPRFEEFQALQSQMKTEADALGHGFDVTKIVWTRAMKRIFALVSHCLDHKEPVLLVGGTGIGKTTVCQVFSVVLKQRLQIVNCHQHTDTADFIGGFRPVREREKIELQLRVALQEFLSLTQQPVTTDDVAELSKTYTDIVKNSVTSTAHHAAVERIESLQKLYHTLFTWSDGALVTAMRGGHLFLVDEISLADDAVLERLNSVLEPNRLLVLAERSGAGVEELVAHDQFRFLATMNPGGDFGKKELSPALRNRFTEIWVPDDLSAVDLKMIVDHNFISLNPFSQHIVAFVMWLAGGPCPQGAEAPQLGQTVPLSLRDVLTWVQFLNTITQTGPGDVEHSRDVLSSADAFLNGAHLVLLDGLGLGYGGMDSSALRRSCLKVLHFLAGQEIGEEMKSTALHSNQTVVNTDHAFGIHPFVIPRGPSVVDQSSTYVLDSGTHGENAKRVLRAMQLSRPVLLEGPPGVGKSSLIEALALLSGHTLVRINLSEQTEISDLMGNDLPTSGGQAGDFCWRDGVFLAALKAGHWVLLDELNLASQAVLEGLNSCLDHRASVWIPEIGKAFDCPPSFRVFGAQNPMQQGGGRKGLPKSFLNRFTKVHLERFLANDLETITRAKYPSINSSTVAKMVRFNTAVYIRTTETRQIGHLGYPWDFNLRDVLRWAELMAKTSEVSNSARLDDAEAARWLDMLYVQRMRSLSDREAVIQIFEEVFEVTCNIDTAPPYSFIQTDPTEQCPSAYAFVVGSSTLYRRKQIVADTHIELLQQQLRTFENLIKVIDMGWLAILVGDSGCGKTAIVRTLARIAGIKLCEYTISSSADTSEFLGCFEQIDASKTVKQKIQLLLQVMNTVCGLILATQHPDAPAATKSLFDSAARLICKGGTSSCQLEFQEELVDGVHLAKQLRTAIDKFQVDCDQDLLQWFNDSSNQSSGSSDRTEAGRFEWVDSKFLEAVEFGGWVVLDNVNLCEPTVLDRLNPLFEIGGVLSVNEQGLVGGVVRTITPHPDFRLFMVMDPASGEISRAMRNRGVEICVLSPRIRHRDTNVLLRKLGVPGSNLSDGMTQFHEAVAQCVEQGRSCNKLSIRDVLQWGRLMMIQVQSGVAPELALRQAMQEVYGHKFKAVDQHKWLQEVFDKQFPSTDVFLHGSLGSQIFDSATWPHPLGVSQYIWDHTYATISREGAVYEMLLHRCMYLSVRKSGPVKDNVAPVMYRQLVLAMDASAESASDDTILSRNAAMAEIAGIDFIRRASMADWNIRTQWLRSVHGRCSGATFDGTHILSVLTSVLEFMFSANISVVWQRQLDGLLTSLVPDSANQATLRASRPIDLRLDSSAWLTLCTSVDQAGTAHLLASYTNALDIFEILMFHAMPQHFVQKQHLEAAATTDPAKMSVLQLSFCASTDSVHPSKDSILEAANDPEGIIPMMHPLFAAIDDVMDKCIAEFSNLSKSVPAAMLAFLQLKKDLWTLLSSRHSIQLDNFLVLWRMFCKHYTQLKEAVDGMWVDTLRKIDVCAGAISHALSLRTVFPRVLWKYGGFPRLPKTERLTDLDSTLCQLCTRFSFCFAQEFDTIPMNATRAFCASPDLKREVVEVLFVLRSIGLINLGGIAGSANKIPQLDVELYDNAEKHIASQTEMFSNKVEELGCGDHDSTCVQLAVATWQLSDHILVRKDFQLLNQIGDIAPELIGHMEGANLPVGIEDSLTKAARESSQVMNFALHRTARSCVNFVARLQMTRIIQSVTESSCALPAFVSIYSEMLFNWHASLWRSIEVIADQQGEADSIRDVAIRASDGPTQLQYPLHTLVASTVLENWREVSIAGHQAKLRQIKAVTEDLLADDTHITEKTRWIHFLNILRITLRCLGQKMSEVASHCIALLLDCISSEHVLMTNGVVDPFDLSSVASRIPQSLCGSTFEQTVADGILSIVELMSVPRRSGNEGTFVLGQLWVLLGRLRLQMLLPPYPIDPVTTCRVKMVQFDKEVRKLDNEIEVLRENESIFRGRETNAEIANAIQLRAKIDRDKQALQQRIVPRPSICQFSKIYQELWNLYDNVIMVRVNSLVTKVKESTEGSSTANQLIREEHICQQTMSRSIARMVEQFPLYRDVVQPCLLAVYEVKHGLRLLVDAYTSAHQHPTATCLMADKLLGMFQTETCNSEAVLDPWNLVTTALSLNPGVGDETKSSPSLSTLQTCLDLSLPRAMVDGAKNAVGCDVCGSIFDLYSETWAAAEVAAAELAASESKEYKTAAEDNSEDQEENLLVSFHNEFAAVSQAPDELNDMDDASQDAAAAPSTVSTPPIDAESICRAHRQIYGWLTGQNFTYSEFFDAYTVASTSVLNTSFTLMAVAAKSPRSGKLREVQSVPAVIFGCGDAFASLSPQLQGKTDNEPHANNEDNSPIKIEGYNVYVDPNVTEVERVRKPFTEMAEQVNELLHKWEAHPILLQMQGIINTVLGLPVRSPVMKVLTGCEVLLHKSQEWEMNASRDVSVQHHLTAIMALVERWRRLELAQWSELLDGKVAEMERQSCRWWFFLHRIVKAFDSTDSEEDNDKVQSLFDSLVQFMQRAPIGEYRFRLNLLQQFCAQIDAELLHCSVPSEDKLVQLALLRNVHTYFSQFVGDVNAQIVNLRTPIESKLKEFIKIARWDKQNYYSLKASSDKSHAKLKEFMRKFGEALLQPVGTSLQDAERAQKMEDAKEETGIKSEVMTNLTAANAASVATIAGHLQSIESADSDLARALGTTVKTRRHSGLLKLYKKMVSLAEITVFSEPSNDARGIGADHTESLATHVIERALALRQSAPMKNMKRKAFASLLKKLKGLGLRPAFANPIPLSGCLAQGVPKDISGTSLNQSLADPDRARQAKSTALIWSRANDYFFRCIFRLQKMRRLAMGMFSSDISSIEVGKCSAYVEHLLTMVVDQRKSLLQIESSFADMRFLCAQLQVTSSAVQSERTTLCLPNQALVSLSRQCELFDRIINLTAQKQLLINGLARTTHASPEAKEFLVGWQRCAQIASTNKSALDSGLAVAQRASALGCNVLACTVAKRTLAAASAAARDIHNISAELQNEVHSCEGQLKMQDAVLNLGLISGLAAEVLHVDSQDAEPYPVTANDNTRQFCVDFGTCFEVLVDQTLVSIQSVCKLSDSWRVEAAEIEEDEFKHLLLKQTRHFERLFAAISVASVHTKLKAVCDTLQRFSNTHLDESGYTAVSLASQLLCCFAPILDSLEAMMAQLLHSFLDFHASLGKFMFVLLNVFVEIFEKGFCKPPEDSEDQESGETDENQAGMGMAEGTGDKDVSEEIEDEEQLLGLQGEQQEEPEGEQERGQGKEMENDFDGDMVEQQRDGEMGSSEEEQDDKGDLDREMDDSEQKPDEQVDEQIWGNPSDDEDEQDAGQDDDKDKEMDSRQQIGEKTGQLQGQDQEGREEANAEDDVQDMPTDDPEEQESDNEGEFEEQEERNYVDSVKPDDMTLPDDMVVDEDGPDEEEEEQEEGQEGADHEEQGEGSEGEEQVGEPAKQSTSEDKENQDEKEGEHKDDQGEPDDQDDVGDGEEEAAMDDVADNPSMADGEEQATDGDEMANDEDQKAQADGAEEPPEDDDESGPADMDVDSGQQPEGDDEKDGADPPEPEGGDEEQRASTTEQSLKGLTKQENTVVDATKGGNDSSQMDAEAEDLGGQDDVNEADNMDGMVQAREDGSQVTDRQQSRGPSGSEPPKSASEEAPRNLEDAMLDWIKRAERLSTVGDAAPENESKPSGPEDADAVESQPADLYQFLPGGSTEKEDAVTEAPTDAHNPHEQGAGQDAEDEAESSDMLGANDDAIDSTMPQPPPSELTSTSAEILSKTKDEPDDALGNSPQKQTEEDEEQGADEQPEEEEGEDMEEEMDAGWYDDRAPEVATGEPDEPDLIHAAPPDMEDGTLTNPLEERDMQLEEQVEAQLRAWWSDSGSSGEEDHLRSMWQRFDSVTVRVICAYFSCSSFESNSPLLSSSFLCLSVCSGGPGAGAV